MVLDDASVTDAYGQQTDLSGAAASLGLLVIGTAISNTAGPSAPVLSAPIPITSDPSTPDTGTVDLGAPVSSTSDLSASVSSTPTLGTSVASTSNSGSVNVFRFFDSVSGTHFYTSSASERDAIIAARPDLVSEGVGLRAVDPTSDDPDAVPVNHFFDMAHGTQFLTASADERDSVIATRPDLTYEDGDVFYEHLQHHSGDTPVYRFFDTLMGTHFYTDSSSERASITQTRPDLTYEGVGFCKPS